MILLICVSCHACLSLHFIEIFKKILNIGQKKESPEVDDPQALTSDDKRSICQRALQNPLSSSTKITRDAHRLSNFEEAGISKKKARKFPLLTDAEKQNRFSFC